MTTMMRVSERTRERVMRIAMDDFGGVTADEAVSLLIDAYWQSKVIAAVDAYYTINPAGWAGYLREAEEWDTMSAPVDDPWDEAGE